MLTFTVVTLSIAMYFIIPWLDKNNGKSYKENFMIIHQWDYTPVLDKIKFLWNQYKNKKGGW